MAFSIRPTTEADWERVRAIRLEMLADTPIAYGDTLEAARGYGDERWKMRARRGSSPHTASLVAVADDGRWVGTMGGYLESGNPPSPVLVSVYVSPGFRGRTCGVADALLDGIEAWAAPLGRLSLLVNETNARAIAFYRRRGYDFTGVSEPYPLDLRTQELEMLRMLPG